MKRILFIFAAAALLGACGSGNDRVPAGSADWREVYTGVDIREVEDNLVKLIADDNMLVTAGDAGGFNSMTAAWGAFGNIWERESAFIMVRNTRYTNQFLEGGDMFTLSFFPDGYRDALTYMGTHSGRDGDKVAGSGLTPVATPNGSMAYGQARIVVECRRIYADRLDAQMTDDAARRFGHDAESWHNLYIGEIVAVWVKR